MYHFFVDPEQIADKTVFIEGNDYNHIKNVLRMQPGEEIAVGNGVDNREFRCSIESFDESRVICQLLFIKEADVELPAKMYLFQGLPKADKMELIIQKAVELGVCEIIPVATQRAIVKLDAKKEKNKLARWQEIALAAAKQSKRAYIPNVHSVLNFKEAVAYAKDMDVKMIPYEMAEGMQQTKHMISSIHKDQKIAVFIGPEGGFTENEIVLAQENGILPVTLGRRILRTETAGLTILAWMMYQLEE